MPPHGTQSSRTRDIKACTACAKAKCKCEIEQGQKQCKRCERLGKLCRNQEPGAHKHKRAPDGQVRRADILRLESKFDSVSQLLAPSTTQSPSVTRNPSPICEPSIDSSYTTETSMPNMEEAARFLNIYRTEMAPLFPFVTISSFISPEELRIRKPILYSSIMMVACQCDVTRQMRIAQEIRQAISEAILVHCENNLALLEGILVFIAWNHMHIGLGSQLFNFLHLAIAMVTELELNKEPHSRSRTRPGAFSEILRDHTTAPPRSLEERRVLLGLYWLCSIINICFKEMQYLRCSSYVTRSCQVLEDANECFNDTYLVKIVRLQQKADRISDILYEGELDDVPGMSTAMAMTISSLEKEVSDLTVMTALDGPQAPILQMAQQTLTLHLYKVSLKDKLFAPSTSHPANYITLRPNLLKSCLSAIDSLMQLFFSLPHQLILSMPYTVWGQIGHAIFVLSRFNEIHSSTWNVAYLPTPPDYRDLCMKMAIRLEEAMAYGMGLHPTRSLPEIITVMVVRLRQTGGMAGQSGRDSGMGEVDGVLLEDELTSGMLIDFFDFGQGW